MSGSTKTTLATGAMMMMMTPFAVATSLPCGVVHRVGRTADCVVDRVFVREIFDVLVDRATASVHEKVDNG